MSVIVTLLFAISAYATPPQQSLNFYACGVGVSHTSVSTEDPGGADHIIYEYEDLLAPENHPSRYRGNQFTIPQGSPEVRSESPWTTYISKLTFAFSTESFGTYYFVELCYTTEGNLNPSNNGYYYFTSQIQIIQRLINSQKYTAQARLAGKLSLECDLKNAGGNTQSFDPSRFERDFWYETSLFDLGNGNAVIQFPINSSSQQIPLGCKARLSFQELSRTQRPNGSSIQEINTLSSLGKDTNENFY